MQTLHRLDGSFLDLREEQVVERVATGQLLPVVIEVLDLAPHVGRELYRVANLL